MWWNDIKEVKETISSFSIRLTRIKEEIEEINLNQQNDFEAFMSKIKIAGRTKDQIEDYMKNVDKLNAMINEFKGCVSIARSAMSERKELDSNKFSEINHKLDRLIESTDIAYQTFYNKYRNLIEIESKLDKLINFFFEKDKPKKKRTTKKKEQTHVE